MSRLPLRCVACVALLALSIALRAEQDRPQVVSARMLAAQELLLAVYPDLAETRPNFTIDDEGGVVTLGVRTGADQLPKGPVVPPTPVVAATVAFDRDGEWRSFDARGPLVKTDDFEALRQRVTKQPFRSSSESQAWFDERRAKHGPDRAPVIEEQLKRDEFVRLFRGEVTIQPGVFQWREPDVDARVMPGWTAIITQSRGPDLPPVTYRALLEPFSGRPVRIVRER